MPTPKKWNDLDESTLMVALDKLDMNLKVENLDDDGTRDSVLLLLQNRLRSQRHNLHKHFKKFSSVQTAKDNKPGGVTITDENWKTICDHFSDPKYQEEMERRRAQAIAEGRVVDTWKIADDVLKKRSGYVAGLGYGPKPKKAVAATTTKIKKLESENAELKDEFSDIRARMERQEALLERLLALNNQTSLSVDQSSLSSW